MIQPKVTHHFRIVHYSLTLIARSIIFTSTGPRTLVDHVPLLKDAIHTTLVDLHYNTAELVNTKNTTIVYLHH